MEDKKFPDLPAASLDLSLTSPGLCIYTRGTLWFYFWPQHAREEGFVYETTWSMQTWNQYGQKSQEFMDAKLVKKKKRKQSEMAETVVKLNPDGSVFIDVPFLREAPTCNLKQESEKQEKNPEFPLTVKIQACKALEKMEENRMKRYERVTADILQILQRHAVQKIYIEGYAFNANPQASDSISILYELGGIVRQALYQQNIVFVEIAPKRIKKFFTGSGQADKPHMLRQFQKMNIIRNFLTIMMFDITKKNKDVKPIQDMVDAFAILHFARYSVTPTCITEKF